MTYRKSKSFTDLFFYFEFVASFEICILVYNTGSYATYLGYILNSHSIGWLGRLLNKLRKLNI